MVNFALDGERDTCLQGEVQQFRRAHERVADLTEDLAKLKKLYWNTQWEEYNSLCTLAHTNAFQCLELHILHGAPLSSNIPYAVLNAGVNNLLHTMPWVWTHAAIEVSWYQGEQLKLLGEIVCNDLMFGLIRLDMALADNYGSGAGSLDCIGFYVFR